MKEKIKCKNCDGDGWYMDHSLLHYENMTDRDCTKYGCPVQVPCEVCLGEGYIEIETSESLEDDNTGSN